MRNVFILGPNDEFDASVIGWAKTHFPGARVCAAHTREESVRYLTNGALTAIVADLVLADGDCLDLLVGHLKRHENAKLFIASDFPFLGDIAESFGADASVVIESRTSPSPEFFERLAHAINETPDSIITGMPLLNILQSMQVDSDSCLRVFWDDASGAILFNQGAPVFASTLESRGEKALIEMLAAPVAQVWVFHGNFTFEQNIERPLTSILMEFCRQQDEANYEASLVP